MLSKKRIISGLLFAGYMLAALFHLCWAEDVQKKNAAIVLQLSDRITAEILPEMELLSGVLSQTSWMEERGPENGKGNAYFQELQAFFSKYRDHEAVKLAEELTELGFAYDAPPNFILHLSPLPGLDAPYGYSDYLIQRAQGEERLEHFRKALRDLAQQSDFLAFFATHRPLLEATLTKTVREFSAQPLTDWLAEFYGWSADEFRLVFAPGMPSGGGYGVRLERNGRHRICQVIREEGYESAHPIFPSGMELAELSLHEFSHSFVNPSFEKYQQLFQQYALQELYEPVKERMKQQAYGQPSIFFFELGVRAVTALGLRDLYGRADLYQQHIYYNLNRDFYPIKFTLEQLEYYQAHRDEFPRFDKFVPYLLKQYADHKETLLAVRKKAEQEKQARLDRLRLKYLGRMNLDKKTYTSQEVAEIKQLYQEANNQQEAVDKKAALKTLVERYPGSNRAGCAMLYLAQMGRKGKDFEHYLIRCINEYSDCFYGDGVQVGAYARYRLWREYMKAGLAEEAQTISDEMATHFHDAVDHQGNILIQRMNPSLFQ